MSDRERRVLESIEQELRRSDPEFVRLFTRLGRRRLSGPGRCCWPSAWSMLVLGSAIVSVAVAVLGIGHRRGRARGRLPPPARLRIPRPHLSPDMA